MNLSEITKITKLNPNDDLAIKMRNGKPHKSNTEYYKMSVINTKLKQGARK